MRAITLYQPWATLMALGLKRFETRSWSTPYRGPLAIHAGKRELPEARVLFERYRDRLLRYGLHAWSDLPLGAIVATGDLVQCYPTGAQRDTSELVWSQDFLDHEGALERVAGDYSPGRYAWLVVDSVPVDPPVFVRGMQGLWEWSDDRG